MGNLVVANFPKDVLVNVIPFGDWNRRGRRQCLAEAVREAFQFLGSALISFRMVHVTRACGLRLAHDRSARQDNEQQKSPKYGEPSRGHLTIPLRINLLGDSTPNVSGAGDQTFFRLACTHWDLC